MIRVRMGNDGLFDRPPWVDVEVTAFTIKSILGDFHNLVHRNFIYLFIMPRVFCASNEQALLRGDARKIPAMIRTGAAINKPTIGSTVTPDRAINSPVIKRTNPIVKLDTRSIRHSFLFIVSPLLRPYRSVFDKCSSVSQLSSVLKN
jgi:hypothetical protein